MQKEWRKTLEQIWDKEMNVHFGFQQCLDSIDRLLTVPTTSTRRISRYFTILSDVVFTALRGIMTDKNHNILHEA